MSDSSSLQIPGTETRSHVSEFEQLKHRFAHTHADMAMVQQLVDVAYEQGKSRELLAWLAQGYDSSGKGLLAIISVLLDLDEQPMARQVVEDALSLHSMYREYLFHFAELLIAQRRYSKACSLLGWLCEACPENYKLHQIYLKTLYRLGEHDLHHAYSQKFSKRFAGTLEFALEDIRAQVYRPSVSRLSIHEAKRKWAADVQSLIPEHPRPSPRSTSKLRIALVGDYLHPMFIEPVLRHYDSNTIQIEIFTNDARVEQIWPGKAHPLNLDDLPGVAAQMREMQIDILIEMTARIEELQLMSYRPAPLQGGWIATNMTQAFSFSDFVLADPVMIPHQERDDWSEEIVDLPVWAPFRFYENVPDVQPCPSETNGYITFGACQRAMKFNDETLAVWATLLSRVPRSRLILKDQSFADPIAAKAMRERCVASGIVDEDLILEPGTPHPEYYDYYHQIDIFLDTTPYGGGILTAESLWMGVPVVTVSGDRFNGRLAHAYLQAIGAQEWVTFSVDDYLDTAMSLAADTETRRRFRKDSRSRMLDSVIMKHKDYAQKWGEAMWELHRNHLNSFEKAQG